MRSINYKPLSVPKSLNVLEDRSSKITITMLQYKRVIAPYIFCNYIYPALKEIYNNKLELHIIQHIPKIVQFRKFLDSNSLPNECLDIVRNWTECGYFNNARLHSHSQDFVDYPSMPSYLLSFNIVNRFGGDLNLHLEDDSLVYDRRIN